MTHAQARGGATANEPAADNGKSTPTPVFRTPVFRYGE